MMFLFFARTAYQTGVKNAVTPTMSTPKGNIVAMRAAKKYILDAKIFLII
jgi:hypothetical protein